ncbi:hypothetical protein N9N67_10920, partial [Bacteriovoracaceae bacterium]|nr:hypothetical protein [Bacteriovoracaceae bacterium]
GITHKDKHQDNAINYFIYKKISQNFKYPLALREKHIEGHVKARIVFNKDGSYNEKLTTVSSNSGFLKVLAYRNLKKIFKEKLRFDLSFIKHKYLILDAAFLVKAKANENQDFINQNTFINGRYFSFLVQNEGAEILEFYHSTKKNDYLVVGVQLTPGNLVNYIEENFTDAGIARKLHRESILNYYQKDPYWDK